MRLRCVLNSRRLRRHDWGTESLSSCCGRWPRSLGGRGSPSIKDTAHFCVTILCSAHFRQRKETPLGRRSAFGARWERGRERTLALTDLNASTKERMIEKLPFNNPVTGGEHVKVLIFGPRVTS